MMNDSGKESAFTGELILVADDGFTKPTWGDLRAFVRAGKHLNASDPVRVRQIGESWVSVLTDGPEE